MRVRVFPELAIENQKKSRSPMGIGWIWRILYILYCLEVGVFLLFFPFLSLWDSNYLVYLYPDMRPVLTNSFLKGAVSGLGIVNIVIGIHEIVHFRKSSKGLFTR